MPDFLTTRAAQIAPNAAGANAPESLDESARTVVFALATESPARVWDWERGIIEEVLLMSGANYPAQVPLLDAHNRYSVESQLGSLRALHVEGAALCATAYFSSVARAEEAFAKVREGHLTDISVGYSIEDAVWIPEGETATVDGRTFSGPLRVVRKWRVKEGSLTPIGADEQAKARSAGRPETLNQTEAGKMPEIKDNGPEGARTEPGNQAAPAVNATEGQRATPAAPATTPAPAPAPGQDAESVRAACAEIVALGIRHGCPDFAEGAIRSGMGLDQFRAQLLDRISNAAEAAAPRNHIAVGEGEGEKFRRAATDALLMRSDMTSKPDDKAAPGALELRGFTMTELARECLRYSGKPTSGDGMTMIGRAFTTSDFPAILADVAHKAVLRGAEEANETFAAWVGEANASDFKTHTGVALDSFSSLDLVPEGGEYKYGQTSDRGVPYSVATYGKLFAVTRQAVVNDDLNALTTIPALMGRAAMRTVGNIVYDLLLKNDALADGIPLFAAAHKNLAANGDTVDVATFGAGVTAMGTHRDGNGAILNLRPAYLIVPIALQAQAFQLLHGQVIGTQAQPNVPNPWANSVVPVPEGRLDGHGALAWYIAAAKGFSVNVAWLHGNKVPRVEQRQGWNIDGAEYKVGIDAGAFVADWRGLYKNPGKSA